MERFRRPSTWVALLLALVAGAAITLAQLDRQARSNGGLAEILPEGYGGFADERRAQLALATDPAAAGPYVRAVAETRPVDISHLSHLAVWAAETDQMDLAARTLNEAATRGWRDTFVQVSVLGSAAAQGNLEAAAQRLDALARFEADTAILIQALDILLTLDGAESVVAQQLSQSEYLQDVLVDYTRQRPQSGEAVNDILQLLAKSGYKFDCVRRTTIVLVMLQRGEPHAQSSWGTDCGGTSNGSLDFTFDGVDDNPYIWTYQPEAGLSVRSGREPGSITLTNRKLVEKVAARKFMALPVGTHSISVAKAEGGMRTIAGNGPADFEVFVICLGGLQGGDRILGRTESAGTLTFTVPENCASQQLRVRLGRGRVEDLKLAMN